tara:strand:+ start:3043 stop:4002 length:960 start_codon:yes stop_codon:yes gene_type:complete
MAMEDPGLQKAEEAFSSMLSSSGEKQQSVEEADVAEAEDSSPDVEETSEELETSPEEEHAEEEPDEETYYPIKLDGVDHEITLQEALNGYQRQSDYTKKTQMLAQEKQVVEAERAKAENDRLAYQQKLEQLVSNQSSVEEEPDWDQLYQDDPLEWMKKKEDFRSKKEKQQELKAEYARVQQQKQIESQNQMRQFIAQQHDLLLDAIPEWKDPKVMATEKAQIREYAKKHLQYSDAELSQIFDARAVLALKQGMMSTKIASKGKAKLKTRPDGIRAVKPGSAGNQRKKGDSLSKAKIRLAKSGSVQDATEVFKQLLSKKN